MRAKEVAFTLSGELWMARERFQAELPNAAEAVKRAMASTRPPAVIVETGDNVGGGSAGDSTAILSELLRQGATGWVVCLYAPEAVKQCVMGEEVRLTLGGPPVEVTGRVKLLHDGTYVETQARHGGKRTNYMGPTALVEADRGSFLVLTSLRHPPFSLGALTCVGLEPAKMRVLVVKAAIAYKAAYRPVAGEIIEADTPGLTSVNPSSFTYRHAPRLFPLGVPVDSGLV
jgi:microcystin degradation protein MlrC